MGSRNGEATPNQRDTSENLTNTIYLHFEEVKNAASGVPTKYSAPWSSRVV
jgi:hypothetical protein